MNETVRIDNRHVHPTTHADAFHMELAAHNSRHKGRLLIRSKKAQLWIFPCENAWSVMWLIKWGRNHRAMWSRSLSTELMHQAFSISLHPSDAIVVPGYFSRFGSVLTLPEYQGVTVKEGDPHLQAYVSPPIHEAVMQFMAAHEKQQQD